MRKCPNEGYKYSEAWQLFLLLIIHIQEVISYANKHLAHDLSKVKVEMIEIEKEIQAS